MMPIGETLRRERLRRNLDLEQISRELKISRQNLEAIENEQFDRLPGAIFVKSFVRQYARLLELDEAEMSAELQGRFEPEPLPTFEALRSEPPRMTVKVPGLYRSRGIAWKPIVWSVALLALVVLASSGVYVFWQQSRAARLARRQQAVQQPLAQAAQPQIAATQSPAPAPEQPSPAAPAIPEQADRASANNPAQSTPAPAQPVSSAPASAPIQPASVNVNPNPNAEVRVKLTAQEPVWVRASNNGKYMFSGTVEANQTREIDGNGQIELLLGNAGGANIEVNGSPIGPVGPKGQIRTVQLRSGGFNIVPPKPAVPAGRF